MASPGKKPKSGSYIKQPTPRFSNRIKSISCTLLVSTMLIVVIVFYGMLTKRDVQLGPKGVRVTDPINENKSPTKKETSPTELANPTEQQTNWQELYDEQVRENKELKKTQEKSVLISRFPSELQGSADEVVAKTRYLLQKQQEYHQSIWF